MAVTLGNFHFWLFISVLYEFLQFIHLQLGKKSWKETAYFILLCFILTSDMEPCRNLRVFLVRGPCQWPLRWPISVSVLPREHETALLKEALVTVMLKNWNQLKYPSMRDLFINYDFFKICPKEVIVVRAEVAGSRASVYQLCDLGQAGNPWEPDSLLWSESTVTSPPPSCPGPWVTTDRKVWEQDWFPPLPSSH